MFFCMNCSPYCLKSGMAIIGYSKREWRVARKSGRGIKEMIT